MAYARFEKPVIDGNGALLSGVWCEVRRLGVANTPLEPLFSDRLGDVPLSNPFFTSGSTVAFHAAGGAFQLRIYKSGYDETFSYIPVGLASESDLQGLVPMGAWDDETTYIIGDLTTHPDGGDLYLFASKVNDNLDNEPDATTPGDTAYWAYMGIAVQGPSGAIGLSGEPLIVTVEEAGGINTGTYPMALHYAGQASFGRFFAQIVTGSGTAEVYIYHNESPVYGPVTVDSSEGAVFETDLDLSLVEGDRVAAVVSAITGTPEVLWVQVGGPGSGDGNADWEATEGPTEILNKPTLGDAAAKDTGTTAGTVAAGDDARIVNALRKDTEGQDITGGARVTVKDLGNLNGASITPDPGDRPIQKVTNNGAGSILPGSDEGAYTLQIVNASGAGAITTTGWTLRGDAFDTTSTSKFLCSCIVTSDMKVMTTIKVA